MSNNETLIPIPGRLHSVATEGNVVGANEVVDDTNYDVPKKQSEINADTALEIKNIKAKASNIESLIPLQATSSNQLADKAFVNSSIATATATFRGTFNVITDLGGSERSTHKQIQDLLDNSVCVAVDDNDYCFVLIPTSSSTPTEIARVERYKATQAIAAGWRYEYTLNNSGFTAAQWATIQSGMTLALTNKLVSLPNNTELQEALTTINNTLNGKQNVINDLSTIRNKATTAYQKPAGGIPSTDLADGVIPSFTVVEDHSGAGDDPNKIYIPSAESHKQLYDGLIEDEEVLGRALINLHTSIEDHVYDHDCHVTPVEKEEITTNTESRSLLEKIIFNGHEYFDLKLPSGTLWATKNIGANIFTDAGKHFMWGKADDGSSVETDFVFPSPYTADGEIYVDKYKKVESGDPAYDIKQHLDITDDAARKHWGGAWRVPTEEQWNELFTSTSHSIETINGVKVMKFRPSKASSNPHASLYIPFVPIFGSNESIEEGAYYHIADILGTNNATCINIANNNTQSIKVWWGLCIRPVICL